MAEPFETPSEGMDRLAPNDSEVWTDDEVRQQPPPAAAEERNWAELPRDALGVIFCKLGAYHVMNGAQWVCRPWRQLSREPQTWRVVDMTDHTYEFFDDDRHDLLVMAKEVIARSDGQMEEFRAKYFADDNLMEYIAERTNGQLKRLELSFCYHRVSDKALVELARRSPQLEVLVLSFSSIRGAEFIEQVSRACSQLKVFCRSRNWCYFDYAPENQDSSNSEALAIANNMQELIVLQLNGSGLTNVGLEAILDGCLKLEILILRNCNNLKMDESMRKKCAGIKDFRFSQKALEVEEYDSPLCSRDVDFYSDGCSD